MGKLLFISPTVGRFNRNIVECKGEERVCDDSISRVLIETLWNVKYIFMNQIVELTDAF